MWLTDNPKCNFAENPAHKQYYIQFYVNLFSNLNPTMLLPTVTETLVIKQRKKTEREQPE